MRPSVTSNKSRPDPRKSLVGFIVGEVAYAVPIVHVQEIVSPLTLTELPHLPDAVAGVADHRGQVIPIVDLRARFRLPKSADRRRAKWIVVRIEERTFGVAVDRVTDVFGTGGVDIRPAPGLGGGDDSRGIVGVTSYEGGLVFVLDVSRLYALVSSFSTDGLVAGAE